MNLSPSALNLYKDCRTCFWFDRAKKFKRPRGIFPSLPGGMDRVIKVYFDHYRLKKSMPPELRVEAFRDIKLYDNQKQLDLWREWRTGAVYQDEDGSRLSGAVDDLMVTNDRYIPFDYKTKGSPTTAEAAVKYYQTQLDCYALMLHENGLPSAGFGFLLYYSPKTVGERGQVGFHIQAIKIQTDVERARRLFREAVVWLKQSQQPEPNPSCEYCTYLDKFASLSHHTA